MAAPGRGSIISEQAEKQVAAAFGELSDVFAANRRKSFDEMAERMLRPMLQEWLDDNLPGLVEKLVREEIERVARGDAYCAVPRGGVGPLCPIRVSEVGVSARGAPRAVGASASGAVDLPGAFGFTGADTNAFRRKIHA